MAVKWVGHATVPTRSSTAVRGRWGPSCASVPDSRSGPWIIGARPREFERNSPVHGTTRDPEVPAQLETGVTAGVRQTRAAAPQTVDESLASTIARVSGASTASSLATHPWNRRVRCQHDIPTGPSYAPAFSLPVETMRCNYSPQPEPPDLTYTARAAVTPL